MRILRLLRAISKTVQGPRRLAASFYFETARAMPNGFIQTSECLAKVFEKLRLAC